MKLQNVPQGSSHSQKAIYELIMVSRTLDDGKTLADLGVEVSYGDFGIYGDSEKLEDYLYQMVDIERD